MLCEMCGKDYPHLKQVLVEGTKLALCPGCSKFGIPLSSPEAKKELPVVEARLEQREKRYAEKSVFEKETLELAEDYNVRIRKAREKKGMNQEELGIKMNEKKSVIAKLESGDMKPSEGLVRKLERELGISLFQKAPAQVEIATPRGSSRNLTIGDLIKIQQAKQK
ncbi:MAG: multiprotein bridging factor aMBF1 [Candidatus Thermoplasmatota archaeon]|nr:multiprotein bridging factor aMBF1 [Candidatus Thermoplasmatota archaeon]